MTPEESQAWLLSLERERFSYREPAQPQVQIQQVVKYLNKPCKKQHTTRAEREKRDHVFYHAGRFAQGARDQVAVEAQLELDKFLGEAK